MIATSEPLVLPAAVPARRRAALPLLASIVPVIGGVVMWFVTGSLLALCFAALGPLMAVAALVDGARTTRRDRRVAGRERVGALTRVEEELRLRHVAERESLAAHHPDAARLLERPAAVWRPVAGTADVLVVGRGTTASAVRVVGGEGAADDADLRARAGVLRDAPVTIPLTAGVCVQGHPVVAAAVLRGLIVQLCLAHPPSAVSLVAVPGADESWSRTLPHRTTALSARGALRVAAVGPGDPVPASADVVLMATPRGAAPHPRCGALLTVTAPTRAELHWAGEARPLNTECLSATQAEAAAALLTGRSGDAFGAVAPPIVTLADAERASHGAGAVMGTEGSLSALIGMAGPAPAFVDLVTDGPHAIVAGVTGSGKSELLITWVVSLCAAYSTSEVAFLLADFKGGTAFDALAALPHVTGVITDLDAAGSRRAVESLRAELRWREAELARVGARDIRDARVRMPRLVIVVDEFAAMLAEHPDLNGVFTDVAARGRALGMHLVLGTQRVTGVVRDAVLANCPLRVSLRVTDAADSRAVVGTDDAALLPGGESSRGTAFVRRAADPAPHAVRVALSGPDDLRAIALRRAAEAPPRRPWLPALPVRLALADLPPGDADRLLLGVADEPERQRQDAVALDPSRERGLVVVGGPGSGKSNLLRLIAAQDPGALMLPRDPEAAWDDLERAAARRPGTVLIDDLDALLARLPQEHAHGALDRVEAIARDASAAGSCLVFTAQSLSGPLARIAELVAAKAVLAMPSRADHVAAGGDPRLFETWVAPGRGAYGGRAVQFALAPEPGTHAQRRDDPQAVHDVPWAPETALTGVVTRGGRRIASALEAGWGSRVVSLADVPPGTRAAELIDARAPLVLVGDGDVWQAHWGLLQGLRAENPLLVDAACPTELRTVAGERGLPPYARPGAGRAWLCRDGFPPERVVLPLGTEGGPGR